MKLTTLVTVVIALGTEIALATPFAQQAPVEPNHPPDCLPDGLYRSQAGLPGSACCSGYFADGYCKQPPHLLVKDTEKRAAPLDCTGGKSCGAKPVVPKPKPPPPPPRPVSSALCLTHDAAGKPTDVLCEIPPWYTDPPKPKEKRALHPPEPENPQTAPQPGPSSSSWRRSDCVTVTGPNGAGLTDVPCPTSSYTWSDCLTVTGDNGAGLTDAPCPGHSAAAKGAADVVPSSVSRGVSTDASSSFSQPSFSFVSTFAPIPTVTSSSTSLNTRVPIPVGTGSSKHPFGPGSSHTLAHKPYPTNTQDPGAWDAELPPCPTCSSKATSFKPFTSPGFSHIIPHPPLPITPSPTSSASYETFSSWSYEKRAAEPFMHPPFVPGQDNTIVHQPFPTTDESSWVHHVGPGWSHTLAHRPLPTKLAAVDLEKKNINEGDYFPVHHSGPDNAIVPQPFPTADESSSVHFVGPRWSHTLTNQPLPTTLATVVLEKSVDEKEPSSVHRVGPGWDHIVAVRPLPIGEDVSHLPSILNQSQ
ncbi:MAG: hypothetical protein Q9209_000603 [Squamulea sp. 1 TL-2023]